MNVPDEAAFLLLVGYGVVALGGSGPYFILALHGEQGTAKSTVARILRALVDPHKVPQRRPPKDERDLVIAAKNNYVIAFDNVSHLPQWFSDSLSSIATGGGFGTRKLYTDTDETLINVRRPIILNGLPDLVEHRQDLAERAIVLFLPRIVDTHRRSEQELWRAFDEAHPKIFGAFLDVLSGALRNLPKTHLKGLPRMADAVTWVTAAESALGWPAGSFINAYEAHLTRRRREAAELDAVVVAIRDLLLRRKSRSWSGTVGELLATLNRSFDAPTWENRHSKAWPSTPGSLGKHLRRAAPLLEALGIESGDGYRGQGNDTRKIVRFRLPLEAETKATARTARKSRPSSVRSKKKW